MTAGDLRLEHGAISIVQAWGQASPVRLVTARGAIA